LLLKKISEDLDYLKESLDIVRENPYLQKLNSYNLEEVSFSKIDVLFVI
jgi:hypothetical protein